MSESRVVLGLGSSNGDDQFGWDVIDALEQAGYDDVRKISHPVDALPWLDCVKWIHIVDAVIGLHDDEMFVCLHFAKEDDRKRIQKIPTNGTHDVGLYPTLMMAHSLSKPTHNVILWLGHASQFAPMSKLSAKTRDAVERCVVELSMRLSDA